MVRGFDFFFRFATKFFVKNPPAKIDSKFYLFLAKFNQERPKSSQNGAKRAQHGANKGQNGAKRAKMEPKGPNIDQKGAERAPENIEKSMPEKSSAPGCSPAMLPVLAGSLFGRTCRPGDRFWRSFWCLFPSKMRSKIYTEIEPQKNMKNHEKSMEKTMRKTAEICEFATLELLVDYVESSVLRG